MKINKYLGLVAILTFLCSCQCGGKVESGDLPYMPMKAVYENSLEYAWSQKKVLESKLLSDAEKMEPWEHMGRFGSLTLSDERPYKGKNALMIVSPTKGPNPPSGGRPWGTAGAYFRADSADWTKWNRITFWIYPDLPNFKLISVNTVFYNEGKVRIPNMNGKLGHNFQMLENQKWNKVYWEIDHLDRDKVAGFVIQYRLQGNEIGSTETARFFIDEVYLEKVEPDHYEGWNVQPGRIAYNHAGYAKGYPKIAFVSEDIGQKFVLKNTETGKIAKEGAITSKTTPTGAYQLMDFSDVNTEGTYVLEAGKLKTKPFVIGSFFDVFRSSIVKNLNHFYSQRCGFAIPGIHDACHLDWLCTHGDLSVPIHGGWHDAGDLSQGLENTTESAYSMMMLAEKLKKHDPVLAERLLEEAEWGVSWILRTRFGDGFRKVWSTKDMWTDGIIGNSDDSNSRASNDPNANFLATTTEAVAALALKQRNPFLATHALQCAIEDFAFATAMEERRMSVQLAGAGLNAALALYEATKDVTYKNAALKHANYLLNCQQQENVSTDVPLKGFFYRTPAKEVIYHGNHKACDQDFVVGLVKLATLFPSEAAEWKKALQLYADYYKAISAYTAPYYMIPAGVYDLSGVRNRTDSIQITGGVKLSERYYMKRFPTWTEMRGNSGTTLSVAKGLSVVGNYLKDKALLEIAYRAIDWHIGVNPFTQSLIYGEGYMFAGQYSTMSGNLVGGMPVGVETYFNNDAPFWPAENCHNWKEIWVFPSMRWFMLVSDFL